MNWEVVLPLYASGIFWTLAYDTIYAHQVRLLLPASSLPFNLALSPSDLGLTNPQDKKDDIQVGIKSTALRFGTATKPILTAFTLAQLSLLGLTGVSMGCGLPFYTVVAAAGGIQGWMIKDVDIDDPRSCAKWFLRNVWTGGVVWLGCLAEWAVRMGAGGLGEWFSITG
jgi:4-hydroxybenzoate polyprenyltransferase